MWKKWVSLNLALLLATVLVLPSLALTSSAAEDWGWKDNGYIKVKMDDNADPDIVVINCMASNGYLKLYDAFQNYYNSSVLVDENFVVTGYKYGGESYALSDMVMDVAAKTPEAAPILIPEKVEGTNLALCVAPTLKTQNGKDYVVLEANGNGEITFPVADDFTTDQNGRKVLFWKATRNLEALAGETITQSQFDHNRVWEAGEGIYYIKFHEGLAYNRFTYQAYDSLEDPLYYINTMRVLDDNKDTWIPVGMDSTPNTNGGSFHFYSPLSEVLTSDQLTANLYLHYVKAPDSYYVLTCNYGMDNGNWSEVLTLPDDGMVTPPKMVGNGVNILYWFSGREMWPAGDTIRVSSDTELNAWEMSPGRLYACLDGVDGEFDPEGWTSSFTFVSCEDGSNGNATHTLFQEYVPSIPGAVLTGYQAVDTGKVYDLNADVLMAIQQELAKTGNDSQVVRFQAVYDEPITDSAIQYMGNHADTADGKAYSVIDNLTGNTAPAAENMFVAPQGKRFAGWNTNMGGYGTAYDAGDDVPLNGVTVLYAQWEPVVQKSIQYFGNGAVTSTGEAYVEITDLNETSTLMQNMFIAPDGKYFLGWNTSPSGNGKWYMPGDTIPLTKNEILYAQWGLCRVTFHDGNFISQSNVMFDYIAPGYTGHPSSNQVFAGWNTAEDGSGTWYRAGMSIVHGAILDLYAQYLTKPETGYYYILSGYSVSPDLLAELKYMDALTEEITLPKSGIGWTTLNYPYEQPYGFLDEVEQFKAPGSTVTVTSGTIYHSLDNIACATLHKNTGEDDETRVFYRITTRGDLLLPSADAAFSDIPSDLVFTGWNTTADGSGQTLENMPVAVYWPTEYELYAQWERKEAPEEPDMPPVVRPPHSSAQPDQPMTPEMPDFADVAPTAWYAEAVDYVVEAGLMTGTGGGKFSPEQTVSRAMVMTVLARLAGVDTDGGDTWYEKALVWAVESGITDGSNPTGIITREQLVTMLYRQAGSPTQDTALSGFDDIDTVSPWAKDAMIWAVEHNILNGINGSLAPQGTATRAQMAALFQRILEQA